MDSTVTRKDLFNLVWSEPMTRLAARYGLSDVALRKKCVKHKIPTPGVGHWAKLAAGHRVTRPKLPKSKGPDLIHLEPLIRSPTGDPTPPVPEVEVPSKLTDPHAAVTFLKSRLEGSATDKYGRLTGGHDWTHCLRPKCLPRLLRLLQGLFLALEDRGHQVKVGPRSKHSQSPDVLMLVHGQELLLRVEERLRKKERPLTKEEKDWHRTSVSFSNTMGRPPPKETKRWVYYPDGDLVLRTLKHWQYPGKETWSDTTHKKLEEQLGKVILGLEGIALYYREVQEAEQRAHATRIKEERARVRPQRMKKYEQLLTENLHEMADNWAKAKQLRAFLDECQAQLPNEPVAREWLRACREYAEASDPFNHLVKIPKTLSPSDEELEQLLKSLS